jgi:cephalosporin-C deacetylase
VPGFLTRGVLDPETFYYRRVFTDAIRAVETARELPGVDGEQIFVAGASQGGGIALGVAGMVASLAGVVVQVPFLCDFPRATRIHDTDPYAELVRYLAIHRDHTDRVLDTLRYFDGVNHARRASASALFSVALMDDICKPSTVFAAYNAYAGAKSIEIYPFNGHEGGGAAGDETAVEWIRERSAF